MAQEPLTPMMKQFHDMKATNPDAILLFRCGDFYETYSDDAVVASQILGITLTKRNQKGSSGSIAMAGFPHHALDNYLPRLIRAGPTRRSQANQKTRETRHHRIGDPWCGTG